MYYEGLDNKGVFHRIPKKIIPEKDGTKLVKDYPAIYDLKTLPKKLSISEFDDLIDKSIPEDVLKRIDDVIEKSKKLSEQGKADIVAEENEEKWRRGMKLSWIHSRDIQVIMAALGFDKKLEGVHDMEEFVLAKRLKERLHSSEKWYSDVILSLPDDLEVNVGFFNPNFSASMYNWGLNKSGIQNAMDAHRLSDHHLGTPENPLDYIEKAANFVVHHLPREHFGIRHEPQGQWENFEEVLVVDHSTRDNPLLRIIARDAAIIIKMLEEEGKITPWQLLDISFEDRIPKNVNLKLQGSTTLRDISFSGGLTFCPTSNSWTITGQSGWMLAESTEGDPLSARIRFSEEIEEGYLLNLSALSTGNSRIVNHQIVHTDSLGFRVLLDTDSDELKNKVGFSFNIKGVKKHVVPDDRQLTPSELIEDINAINNILNHEAEYGMITVMCSASIKDKPTLEKDKKRRTALLQAEREALANTRINSEITRIKHNIHRLESRLLRLDRLIKSSKYWDSGFRFGKMWGEYCSTQQNNKLGGRYVPICTGGGPGIMNAVAKGARSENAQVIGIDSVFGNDNKHDLSNDFSVNSNVRLRCNDFAIREAALINYSHVILFFPGGYGTSWEAFETLCKLQTNHLRRYRTKAIFVHLEFWKPLFDYVKHLEEIGTINGYSDYLKYPGVDDDRQNQFYVGEFVDSEEEAFKVTKEHIEFLYKTNQLTLR